MPLKALTEPRDFSYYPVVALSTVGFLLIYKFGSPWLSSKWIPGYKLLPRVTQLEWNTRVNSSVHAVLVSLMCLYVLLLDETVARDPVWGASPMSRIACSTVAGYMTSDLIVVLWHYKHFGEIYYIFHHLASIWGYYYNITYGVLPWFAMYRCMAEFSTPFVNLRWFLDVLGFPKTSPEFVTNGLAMAVVFCLCRIVTIPPYYFKAYSIYGSAGWEHVGHTWYVLVCTCTILDSLNVFWFYKIFHGARKVLVQTWNSSQRLAKAG